MSDDHAAHAITAYGGIYDSLAPTPNIDINGAKLTDLNDLNDDVHLSVDGAANFAKRLSKSIK